MRLPRPRRGAHGGGRGGLPLVPRVPARATLGRKPPGARLFPTVGIAASLHELRYRHPWLDRATRFYLADLDIRPPREAHRLRFALRFLDALGERERFKRRPDRTAPRRTRGRVTARRRLAGGVGFGVGGIASGVARLHDARGARSAPRART